MPDQEEIIDFMGDLDKEINLIAADPEGTKQIKDDEKKNNIIEEENKEPSSALPSSDKEEELEEPSFKKQQTKKTKEESISELRKQRDEARISAKIFTETFGETPPVVIKPLVELATELIDGPITENAVNVVITELKTLKEENESLKAKIEEKENKISEIDVRYSSQFKEKYETPLKEASDSLFLEFAKISPDNTIIGHKSTSAFHKFLVESNDIDGVKVKSALTKFAEDFKQETGEDISLPSVTSIMSSLRVFKKAQKDMHEAFANWKTKKEEDEKISQTKAIEQEELRKKNAKRERISMASKAYQSFNHDDIDFIEDKEVELLFKEEFQFGEKIIQGEDIPSWDTVIQRGVKARLFDKILPKIKELIAFKKAVDEGDRNGIKGQFRPEHSKGKKEEDWLGSEYLR